MAEIYAFVTDEWVAMLEGVQADLRARTAAGAARAAAVLAAHHHTGDSRIETEHGHIDHYVVLNDDRGQHAAMTIEFGRVGTTGHGTSQGVHALDAAF